MLVPGSGLSPKEALVLIRNLPVESRFIAAVRGGPEYQGWSVDRYMLAELIDAVHTNTYATVRSAGSKKAKPADRFPRPDTRRKNKTNSFRAMAARQIAAARRSAGNGEGTGHQA